MSDIAKNLILNMIEDVGSIRAKKLLDHFGSIERVFNADKRELCLVEDIGERIAEKIINGIKEINIDNELKLIEKHKIKIITFLDKDYPKNLKNIYDPPVILYVQGEILPEDDAAVAIVGSRKASFYGQNTSEKLGFDLASRGITVVSGLAIGIDSSAHKGALKAKGRTLAVLGSGLLNIYPKENIKFAQEISENGAVISEFPMKMRPNKVNFPRRNRIISGLSLGVVVVEAAFKSGALITSDAAMEQGREVFAVPGKIDSVASKGTNKLIKQGAKLIENVDDIMEELRLERIKNVDKKSRDLHAELDKHENLVYNLLTDELQHIDTLSIVSGLKVTDVSNALMNLEIKRFIKQLPGKNFIKV